MNRINILYCTTELENPIDIIEIARLNEFANVKVLNLQIKKGNFVVRNNLVINNGKLFDFVIGTWLKICTLIARLPSSNIAFRFPERNIYQKSIFVIKITNFIWILKKSNLLNNIFPIYSRLAYLFPFGEREARRLLKESHPDWIVYNSLLITSYPFIGLLKYFKKCGIPRIANIRSWDNPYYVQFDSSADFYLVWSEFMAGILERTHKIARSKCISWGPNILKNFYNLKANFVNYDNNLNNKITIGYAAAFGDDIVSIAEFRFICNLSKYLNNNGLQCKFLFRPYPTIKPDFLMQEVAIDCNVSISTIESIEVDRFGDKREFIKFGSPEERMHFLISCDLFLSIGTTFTLEAAINQSKIIHLFIPKIKRKTADEELIFNRIEITCDHFHDYFDECLVYCDSVEYLKKIIIDRLNVNQNLDKLMYRIGVDNLSKIISVD